MAGLGPRQHVGIASNKACLAKVRCARDVLDEDAGCQAAVVRWVALLGLDARIDDHHILHLLLVQPCHEGLQAPGPSCAEAPVGAVLTVPHRHNALGLGTVTEHRHGAPSDVSPSTLKGALDAFAWPMQPQSEYQWSIQGLERGKPTGHFRMRKLHRVNDAREYLHSVLRVVGGVQREIAPLVHVVDVAPHGVQRNP